MREAHEVIPDSLYGTTLQPEGEVATVDVVRELLISNGGEKITEFENSGKIAVTWKTMHTHKLIVHIPPPYIKVSDITCREVNLVLSLMAPGMEAVEVNFPSSRLR